MRNRVIAGFSVERAEDAVPIARALLSGGIEAIELTLRTPAAMDAIYAVAREVPEILLGVGTILTPAQCRQVVEAGASFGMSPGLNADVVCTAKELGFAFAPGIVTPSELEEAIGLGCRDVKFFPAEPSGGVAYLKSMATPYAHLGIRYYPLGGINTRNMMDYLNCHHVAAIGGSWIVRSDAVQKKDWGEIESSAREVQALLQQNEASMA